MLALNGELSDIILRATLAGMQQVLPHLNIAITPRTGLAPTLEEPEAQAAIAGLLAGLA